MPFLTEQSHDGDLTLEPIAICGMGLRVPGADNPTKFWQMLVERRSGNSVKVPKSRFNIDAHLHPNNERPGSFNVPGGYFIDGAAENFDPTFFNMTPVEAMWLDPQQRKILEVCYEAIESAGQTLDSVAGSNTGVYMGSFTADYQQMTFKDPDFRHSYAATGVDPGIISNRIGNIFDLNGPSFTINTACSSSVYAIHNACHALRAGDCDAALVGGSNLILTVDQHMNTAKLGVLSPDSFCHTFDARANGYGRGEGAGAIYLKRLADAVRDGDVIRAAIRSSAVNTNGKVAGYGITYPNRLGQESVIRQAYKRAGLDPNQTAYFEVHGTGTPVGDPIEARAASAAMNDTRSLEKPLIIGAVKPNIGHSEAASGVFAVMKAALMVEKSVIPGVAGLENINPAIPESALNIKINKDTRDWPEGFPSKRASVSSFGYGGTNGHIIVEEIQALLPGYSHGAPKAIASYNHSSNRPLLVTMTAHDKTTLLKNIEAQAAVADNYYLADFVHTHSQKRSKLSYRGFAVADDRSASSDLATGNFKHANTTKTVQDVAFLFTGQGAQWAGVGTMAMKAFPVFRNTIKKLDFILKGLEHPPDFSLEDQLTAPSATSRINNPDVAQATLVAVELAIVDLLASWNVFPVATVGHSAGEYAASYAAGLLSAPEIIIAAYYRGYSLAKNGPKGGAMLAVGKGAAEVKEYLPRLSKDIVIACENSPSSVTLSGPSADIEEAKDIFTADDIFAREVKTGMAYHSSYMTPVAGPMVEYVEKAWSKLSSYDRQWRCPRRLMVSSVTNEPLYDGQVTAEYFARNLTGRVLFDTAVTKLTKQKEVRDVGAFVEIGPHAALQGPFKQIMQANELATVSHIPTILRNKDSAHSLLKTAGELFLSDYHVDLQSVNQLELPATAGGIPKPLVPKTLVDLPSYQWNYDKMFWAEPRASAEYRQLTHARHDLLGSRIGGLSSNAMSWRNVLRLKDIPWLVDHKLGGSVMFPAAGHMSLAIESTRQLCENQGIEMVGATVRDLELKAALVIPESEAGLEIQFRLAKDTTESQMAFRFAVESYNNNAWHIHSEGKVVAITAEGIPTAAHDVVNPDNLTQRTTGSRWNKVFHSVGFEYGPSFNMIDKIRTHENYYQAACQIPIETASNLMVEESRYAVHPSVIDSLLQLCIISIHAGNYQEMPWGVIPTKFEEVTVMISEAESGTMGSAIAWNPVRGERARTFKTNGQLLTPSGKVAIDIKSLHTLAYEAALPPKNEVAVKAMPYCGVTWQPDITHSRIGSILPSDIGSGCAADALPVITALLNHKSPVTAALAVDTTGSFDVDHLLSGFSPASKLRILTEADLETIEDTRAEKIAIPEGEWKWADIGNTKHDLAIFNGVDSVQLILSRTTDLFKSQLKTNGLIVLFLSKDLAPRAQQALSTSGFSSIEVTAFADQSMVTAFLAPETVEPTPTVSLVYSNHHTTKPTTLADDLTKQNFDVSIKTLAEVDLAVDQQIVLWDPAANILSQSEAESFELLKQIVPSGANLLWITSGVNEGKCMTGAMAAGFLRVVREEQKMAKLSLLDIDQDSSLETTAQTVKTIFQATSGTTAVDREYWLHNGACHVSRVVPNADINDRMIVDTDTNVEETLSADKLYKAFLKEGKLTFEPNSLMNKIALGENEIEIQVEHTEIYAKDLNAAIEGPRLIAGKIRKVGDAVQNRSKGDTVVAFTTDALSTVVRVSEAISHVCQPSLAQQLVQSLPDVTKAINALQSVAEPWRDYTIILLPSALALSPSFTLLSKAFGFKLVLESDIKETSIERYMQEVGSSTIVVSSDFSALSRDVWRQMPAGACFVLSENKSGSLAAAPDVGPFNRGTRFCATNITNSFDYDSSAIARNLKLAMIVLEGKDLTSVRTVSIDDLKESVQIPEGSAVLDYKYGKDVIEVVPSEFQLSFSPDEAYLLVGCLGGLGRSLTSFMMERGAKHFAFISRSAADKPEAARLIDSINKAGAITQVFRGDAGNVSDVEKIVSQITAERPIKGVVHAAMVLQDAMLGPGMTLDKFQNSLAPKVDGANVLHKALQGHELDFFVVTSSISATVGQPGQSNYASANSFLDNFAWQRNLQGLAATSLVLPMVLGVGVVAENESLEEKITRRGMYGVDEREMLRGFEAAMSQPVPKAGSGIVATHAQSTIVLGLEPSRLATALAASDENSDIEWISDPRFSSLRALIDAASGSAGGLGGAGGDSFVNQTVATAEAQGYGVAMEMVAKHVMTKCGTILMMDVEDFDLEDRSIGAYGLDSMIGAELRNWLFKEFGLNIAFNDLLAETLTFGALSRLLLEHIGVKDFKGRGW